MIEQLITDQAAWKLRLKINNCVKPDGFNHLMFTGEQYNDEGELMFLCDHYRSVYATVEIVSAT